MRDYRATHNMIAVSANAAETALNTEQTLDTSLLVALSDVINLEPRREHNGDELTGKEEPDAIYSLGAVSGAQFNFNKAQPQHFAFLGAYALGQCATTAAGIGYSHSITPIDGEIDENRSLPSFTAAMKLGSIANRRFASMFVDQLTATFAADDWVKIVGEIKGTGKNSESVIEEEISAADNVTELTLAANGVAGSTDAARLDNVHAIRVELTPGIWTDVEFSAVSSATPAVITITAPGSATSTVLYKVLYRPTAAAWETFPGRVNESPLRVSQATLVIGGAWNGSAFSGGREYAGEVKNVEWSLQNNMQIEFTFGAGGAYASRAFREGRVQTVKLNRDLRNWVIQQYLAGNETFGMRILCEGAVFDDPHKYTVEIIFPSLGALSAPLSVDGKRLAEAGDFQVLQTGSFPSVILNVKNKVSAYAA